MKLFKRKKKQANSIDEAFKRVYKKLDAIDSFEDPHKLEQFVLDSCEQIVTAAKDVEHDKKEYRLITSYLEDIKTIEELPKETSRELIEAGNKILELEKSLKNLSETRRNISLEQKAIISQEEDEIPSIISRMGENEAYKDSLKRELKKLEGEKMTYEITRSEIKEKKLLISRLSMLLLICFGTVFLLLFAISKVANEDMKLGMLILSLVGALSAAAVVYMQGKMKKENAFALAHLNSVIGNINVAKMKFASVTSGLEFTKDKYQVKTSAELNYLWEQYTLSVKDEERLVRGNEDLEFFYRKYNRLLDSLNLHDAKIWKNQIKAIVSSEDMTEARHKLVSRRQKLRAHMENRREFIVKERAEVDNLMARRQHYMPEVQEILKSVDAIIGLDQI